MAAASNVDRRTALARPHQAIARNGKLDVRIPRRPTCATNRRDPPRRVLAPYRTERTGAAVAFRSARTDMDAGPGCPALRGIGRPVSDEAFGRGNGSLLQDAHHLCRLRGDTRRGALRVKRE